MAKEFHQLGLIQAALNHPREAEEAYRHSLELEPERPLVNYSYARLLHQQERLDEAAQHYREFLNFNPQHLASLNALGQIAETHRRFAIARDYYAKAIKASTTPPEQMLQVSNYVRFIASCPDLSVRNLDEAIGMAENLNNATRQQVPGVLDLLAATYAQSGRFDEAIRTARQALTLARAVSAYDLATEIEEHLAKYESRETIWE
ncbi:MAG: tetratricopeptide repeat protein [Planctomycetota bacterium]|nr:tetratricopeptide repeat protein [Planctomycetota bacterium]